MTLRIGTRGSALARAQAGQVAERLGDATLVAIAVSGDERPGAAAGDQRPGAATGDERPGAATGGPPGPAPPGGDKARFVRELEAALLAGEVDLAVHSAKDLPAQMPDGLVIAGVPPREDAGDALCGASGIEALAHGARVGTASVRRRAQLLALRDDLDVAPLRGNVDTRLRRLDEGAADAIVLALAGLRRLGRADRAGGRLEELVPAAGQGALAIQARAGDERAIAAAAALTDPAAERTLRAERALVATLDASCASPVGAHARLDGELIELRTFAGLPDGSAWVRDRYAGPAADPEAAGRTAGERLLAAGAGELLRQADELAGVAR